MSVDEWHPGTLVDHPGINAYLTGREDKKARAVRRGPGEGPEEKTNRRLIALGRVGGGGGGASAGASDASEQKRSVRCGCGRYSKYPGTQKSSDVTRSVFSHSFTSYSVTPNLISRYLTAGSRQFDGAWRGMSCGDTWFEIVNHISVPVPLSLVAQDPRPGTTRLRGYYPRVPDPEGDESVVFAGTYLAVGLS
ncbi:hypothetical protein RUM44_002142 [Polyplax serrata]|uniref:Uncharacterized protein n=1 Tax=Polyplax serrata TaxID=468196 RepID=A0ABR1AM16_POLSC